MSEVAHTPQLRFPEFSDNWEEKTLGNVTSIVMGQSPDSTSYNSNGIGLYLIQGNADIKKRKTLPRVWTDTPTKECKVGDIIMTVRAPVGAVAKSIHNACIGRGVCAIRNNQHSVSNYIYQFLLSFEKKWVKFEQGSTFTAVNTKDVKSLKLILPPVQEQQKIAAFLSAVDNKIEQLSKKQELLGEYKKGLMQQIFSQAIRFKADDGCDFPDWEEKSLGELFNYKNGGSFENEVVKDGLYNLITLNSITIDGELKNEHKKINSFDNSLKINDLIMVLSDVAHGNFLGLTAIIPEDNSYVLNQRMGALKSKGLNNVVFLRLLINYNQKYFKLHGQGSSQQNLSKGDILKFELLLPNRNEQQKIANFLSSIDTKIEQVGKQLDESKQFKKALLQQMFV
jgi:type I restriction enzyme S subunit